MVSVSARRRWLLVLAALMLVAPGAQAVRVLDDAGQLPGNIHAYGAAQVEDEVYLFGGGQGRTYLDDVSVIRSDGSTSTIGSLPSGLKSPAAAAHDGMVYVFGGAKRSPQYDLPETTRDIYRFDPSTGETERLLDASLPDPVAGASAVTVDGTIYVLGGLSIQPDQDDQVDYVDTVVAFDPGTNAVRTLDAQLPTGRAQASAVAAGGDVLYVGGFAEAGPNTCEDGRSTCVVPDVLRLRPDAESVGQIGELEEAVRWSAATLFEGTAYVFGGCRANCGAHQGTAAIQTVDPSTGETEALPVSMPTTGGRNEAVLRGDIAWIPGGVEAVDEGTKDHDRVVAVQLGPTRPWAPVNVSAEAVQGGIALDWEPPNYDGGDAVSGYVVERARGAHEPTRLDRVRDTTYRDLNATEGVTYTYRVRAENLQGLSSPSGEVIARATQPPGPPAVSAQGGDGKIVVQWSPPEDTGGLAISSYRVFAYHLDSEPDLDRCGQTCWGKVSNTTQRATITTVEGSPVENGETYEIRVQARNDNGWGEASRPTQAEAKPVPDAPAGLEAQTVSEEGERSVELRWDAVEAASAYVVYRGASLDELSELDRTGDTSLVDDTELPEGETIVYAVAARNGDADGPISQPVQVVFATPPGEVTDLSARWTGAHVEVAWEPPNRTGGEPVQAYEVARTRGAEDPEAADAEIQRTAQLRYTDGDPPRGTPLAYHVRAVTDAGSGPWRFEQVRVPFTQDSRPPVPALAAHPTKVAADERVVFDASGSSDDDDVVAYNFTFGDGEGTGWRSSPRVTYAYAEAGVYDATVHVRDTSGLEASAQATIAVGPADDPQPPSQDPNISDGPGDGTEDAPLPLAVVLAGLLGALLVGRRRR